MGVGEWANMDQPNIGGRSETMQEDDAGHAREIQHPGSDGQNVDGDLLNADQSTVKTIREFIHGWFSRLRLANKAKGKRV